MVDTLFLVLLILITVLKIHHADPAKTPSSFYLLYYQRNCKSFNKSCLYFSKARLKITLRNGRLSVILEVDANFVILNGTPVL